MDTIDTIALEGGPGLIGSVTVEVDISHTWIGDLEIRLTHDDSNTTVVLQDNVCGNNDDEVVTFDDTALDSIGDSCGSPYVGTFVPQEALPRSSASPPRAVGRSGSPTPSAAMTAR